MKTLGIMITSFKSAFFPLGCRHKLHRDSLSVVNPGTTPMGSYHDRQQPLYPYTNAIWRFHDTGRFIILVLLSHFHEE